MPSRVQPRSSSRKVQRLDPSTAWAGEIKEKRIHPDSESQVSKTSWSSLGSFVEQTSKDCCSYNPLSSSGKTLYIGQMILLPLIPIMALAVQNIYSLVSIVQHQSSMLQVQHAIDEGTDIGQLLTALQMERSEVAFYIFTNGSTIGTLQRLKASRLNDQLTSIIDSGASTYGSQERWQNNLSNVFDFTDGTLERMSRWIDISSSVDLMKYPIFSSKLKFQIRLEDLRDTINHTAMDVQLKVDWYSNLNRIFLEVLARRITARKLSYSVLGFSLAYLNMLRALEHFNIFLTYGLRYYARGDLPGHFITRAIRSDTLFWEYLNNTRSFSRDVSEKIHATIDSYKNYKTFMNARTRVLMSQVQNASDEQAASFFVNGTTMSVLLRDVQMELRTSITEHVQKQVGDSNTRQVAAIAILTTVLVLAPIIILLAKQISTTMQALTHHMSRKSVEVVRERHRADRLLHQMLPDTVVQQLKSSNTTPAEAFSAITVYFSDIVGFSQLSSLSTPIEIVTFLNSLYKMFDNIVDEYDVYKVETVGDAYMCVSGLPEPNGDKHAEEIADLSLFLQQAVKSFEVPHIKGKMVEIRVGLNTGPCVAGVVGTKMPRYCLFGDTINVASRMESTGAAQRIHISQFTHEYLEKTGKYLLEFRGNLDVKGKGNMATYWLNGKKGGIKARSIQVKTPKQEDLRTLLN